MLRRQVTAETLDQLAPADPAARRARRDLVRVHRAMGTPAILARGWQDVASLAPSPRPLRVLEIGAGDGSLMLGVARQMARHWPPVHLTLLDRQDLVGAATLAGYAELGWRVEARVIDVLDWAAANGETGVPGAAPAPGLPGVVADGMPPRTPARWDLISTSLFLHHFEGTALDRLLAAVAARTDRFFACEPRRAWGPLLGSHLVAALGANAVTRADAVRSVHAGFRGSEIDSLWTAVATAGGMAWQTREFAAGLFSHCFSARRAADA